MGFERLYIFTAVCLPDCYHFTIVYLHVLENVFAWLLSRACLQVSLAFLLQTFVLGVHTAMCIQNVSLRLETRCASCCSDALQLAGCLTLAPRQPPMLPRA